MICPQDSNKQYIIPTKKWLKPLEPLITEDINTTGIIMLADFIDKEKVIVKITKDKRDDIIKINKTIKELPNFIQTYCTIICNENFDALDTQYKDSNSFCNANKDSGDIITLEIMKRYKSGSLNKYKNKLELNEVINIMKQLLLAQIIAFNKTGFLHNDIHLGNILVEKTKEQENIKYKVDTGTIEKRKFNIQTNFKTIISDFDKSTIYNSGNLTIDEYMPENTLGNNIFNTFNVCLILFKNKDEKERVRKNMYEKNIDIRKHLGFSIKHLRSYYKNNYDYKRFIEEETNYGISLSGMLLRLLDEHSTDDWYN